LAPDTATREQQLREKLHKIYALFNGATTLGERNAAMAAIDRLKKSLAELPKSDPLVEMQFKLPDRWQRRLFMALCRRYGLSPFRYKGQRFTSVMVKAPRLFIKETLWPEYLELSNALDEYLNEATEKIIREELFVDSSEMSKWV
jgi:hypothetical protein